MNESLETSSDLSTDAMKSFDEYNCEDDESVLIFDGNDKIKSMNPVNEMVNEVLIDRAKYNKSYTAASDFSKRLNSMPGAKIEIPTRKEQMKREANLKYQYEYYIFCDFCKYLFKKDETCFNCGKITKKRKNNYFVYINIKQQILHKFEIYLEDILSYAERERKKDELRDIHDSTIYMQMSAKAEDQIILPLTISLDGAQIFRSSKTTLWPIQATMAFLPPNVRFLKENILIVGLYCGDSKPDISTIIIPFAEEMQMLQRKGIFTWNKQKLLHFVPKVMFCSSDMPARAEIQNCKPSGYFGCPCCQKKGEAVKNPKTGRSYVRFLRDNSETPIRTHEMAVKIGLDVLMQCQLVEPKGLKGVSAMIAFKDFDLAAGFAIDYTHGSLLGITKNLLDIWLGAKKLQYEEGETYRFKSLNSRQRIELNRRIVSLKPTTQFRHKPRPIYDRNFFTANEYRSLLWYYLPFALSGLLGKELVKHFVLLSDATYILCKAQIKKTEVHRAGIMLSKFASMFEYYYGKNAVTINVHMLRHYSMSVINSGPMWCHSMFAFESNIGEIKRSFNCTVDVVEQIAFNYSIRAAQQHESKFKDASTPQILRPKLKTVTSEQENILLESGINFQKDSKFMIGQEMSWKSRVYKSTSSVTTKSVDYFIQVSDGSIGSIELFVQFEKPWILLKKYEIIKIFEHFQQIRPTQGLYKFYPYDAIRFKLIYLKFNYSNVSFREFVTIEPNHFEGN